MIFSETEFFTSDLFIGENKIGAWRDDNIAYGTIRSGKAVLLGNSNLRLVKSEIKAFLGNRTELSLFDVSRLLPFEGEKHLKRLIVFLDFKNPKVKILEKCVILETPPRVVFVGEITVPSEMKRFVYNFNTRKFLRHDPCLVDEQNCELVIY